MAAAADKIYTREHEVGMQSSGLSPMLIRRADFTRNARLSTSQVTVRLCVRVVRVTMTMVVALLNYVVVNHKGLNSPAR